MKIGITGSKGLLGAATITRLNNLGMKPIVLDDFTRSLRPLEDAPTDLDWVLHFAAKTSIDDAIDNPWETYRANFESTGIALEIARSSKAAFLFMSTYLYGVPQYLPVDEDHSISAHEPYSASKIIGETLCQQYRELFKLPVVVLRGFNIYGGKYISGRLISDLLKNAKRNERLEINIASVRRDYLCVDDFLDLLELVICKSPAVSGTFNVGSGVSYSNIEVAEIIREIIGDDRPILVRDIERKSDVPEQVANIDLAVETFGWKPKTSLKDGLRILVREMQQACY